MNGTVINAFGRKDGDPAPDQPEIEADEATIACLEDDGRVAFRYCDAAGEVGDGANPNGSTNHIAGVYSERLNVLGLMPHPENLIDPLVGGTDGLPLFSGLAA